MADNEKILRELKAWEPIMKIDAIASQIRIAQATLTRAEWNKVGKALLELVSEIRQGLPCEAPNGHYKSAMWLLGGKK